MTIRNPLFDPRSEYNQRRQAIDPAEKLQGYFHWLSEFKALALRRVEEASSVVTPAAVPESSGASVREPSLVQAAKGRPLPPSVQVVGYRDGAPEGIEELKVPADATFVKLGDSRLRITLNLEDSDRPSPCACRAYVLEPSCRRRLLAAAGAPPSTGALDLSARRAIFGRSGLNENARLIHLLADVPEIEDRVTRGNNVLEAKLPTDEPPVTQSDFYARNCVIVVVLDDQLLPEVSKDAPAGLHSPE